MNAKVKFTAVALAGMAFALATPSSAFAYTSAPLTVCNKVNFKLILAYGYHSPGIHDPADHTLLTGPFVSRGWWSVEPGQCTTLENPFGARYMYWFAAGAMGGPMSDSDVLAIRNADVPQHFCIDNYIYPSGPGVPAYTADAAAFVYEDQNVSAAACDPNASMQAPNLWVAAHEVDTWVNATVDHAADGRLKP